MGTRFAPRAGPTLEDLGLHPHPYVKAWEGRRHYCQVCPLPWRNRVHRDPPPAELAEWAAYDAARLGEHD